MTNDQDEGQRTGDTANIRPGRLGRAARGPARRIFEDEHFASLAGEDELFGKKPDEESLGYIRTLVSLCAANREEIDSYIEKYAIGWRPERITRTAAAVLRCALAELLYVEDVPPSAVINEAVELAKNYEEPETVAFINGVLGGFMRGERSAAPEES